MKRLLLIEGSNIDTMEAQAAIESVLPGEFSITVCNSLAEALKVLQNESFDAISLGLNLPDSKGLESLVSLKDYAKSSSLIVTLSEAEQMLAPEAISLGAHDFVIKGNCSFANQMSRVLTYAIERKNLIYELTKSQMNARLLRDEFFSVLAHDLKNPLIGEQQVLTSILSGVSDALPPLYYESLVSLRKSNLSLLLMLSNIIDVYKLEEEERKFVFENVDLIKVIGEVLENFKFLIESAEITVVKQDFPDSFMVVLDATAFVRIFSNLLHNACKFGKKASQVNLYLKGDCDKFQFEVENQGPSIKEIDKSILFKRFKRSLTGQQYLPSSGLGLYLCNQLVERLHGSLDCVSSEDTTRMILELPRNNFDT